MNKKQSIITLLLVISPMASALDLGDMVVDVLQDGKLSSQNIWGAVKSITNVTTSKIMGSKRPKGSEGGSVILYSTSWCGYCTKASNYMDSKNIAYINKNIESDKDNQAEYKAIGGTGGVPYIVFGDDVMAGFESSAFDQHYAAFEKEHATKKAEMKSGDMLKGKIAGVKVYQQPKKTAVELTRLGKTDEVIYMGESKTGTTL